MWPFKLKIAPVAEEPKKTKEYLYPSRISRTRQREGFWANVFQRDAREDRVAGADVTMDSAVGVGPKINQGGQLPESLMSWYGSQSFIGHQAAAILAQHWLVYKCCNIPAKDAIRKGYTITVNDGTRVAPEVLDALKKSDLEFNVNKNLEEFVTRGRIFGVRVAFFEVDSPDPEYYLKPFNPDGVRPGSYKGIVQVDPYWCTPELDQDASSNPASQYFYEPTWWRINDRRIHRTHVVIMRYAEVADVLKPTYWYGGVPLPQLLYERVYCAERTAGEAPQLALSKRCTIHKTDLTKVLANQAQFEEQMQQWSAWRDNFGVKVIDLDEEIQQIDTALADLDEVIMTSYQLVAAVANVPATKLLGTAPKGFNSTGASEETSYHEELESIQATNLTPLLDRHHLLLIRSKIAPDFGIDPFQTSVTWEPINSVSALELAQINKSKADTGQVLLGTGAIDGNDERERIINDPSSGYSGLQSVDDFDVGPDEETGNL